MLENRALGFVGKAASTGFFTPVNTTPANPSVETEKTGVSRLSVQDTIKVASKSSIQPFDFANIFSNTNSNTDTPIQKSDKIVSTTELPEYKIDDQGNTNACGTTSLTSVLKYFGSNVKDHWEIDKAIRSTKFDMFTAPGDIVSYARSKGFNAGLKNNSSAEEAAKFIDQGVPVIALIDPGDKYDFNMHWVVLVGYEKNDQGKVSSLKIADPGWGSTYTEDIETFNKEWKNVQVGVEKFPLLGKTSVSTGYNQLIIPIVPKKGTVKTPDGKTLKAEDIKIPHQWDTVHGFGAKMVSRGAVLIDKTVTFGQSVMKKLGL